MRQVAIATVCCSALLADVHICAGQPFPSAGSPNPAMTGAPVTGTPGSSGYARSLLPRQPSCDARASCDAFAGRCAAAGSAPRAVTVARATTIPRCTSFVDAAVPARGNGTAQSPHKTIAAAIAAAGTAPSSASRRAPMPSSSSRARKTSRSPAASSAARISRCATSPRYVSKAKGRGGSFIRIEDPGPKGNQLTAIDGFEITGYSQAIFRDYY